MSYEYFGSGINVGQLHSFIKNGYNAKKEKNLDGYELDKGLSGKRFQAYYHPEKKHLVTNHAGTSSFHDVLSDIKLGLFNDKKGKRFKFAKQQQKKAEEKYKDAAEKTTIGHSLGYKLAQEANKNNNELIALNPAMTGYDIKGKKKANETIIRTQNDPVSYLGKNKSDITIKSKSLNPFKEHSSDTLKRLDQEREL